MTKVSNPNLNSNPNTNPNPNEGIVSKQVQPLKLHACEEVKLPRPAYDFIYLPYKVDDKPEDDFEHLYKKYPDGSQFRTVDKLKLIESMIENEQKFGGAGLNLRELVVKKAILGVYILSLCLSLYLMLVAY